MRVAVLTSFGPTFAAVRGPLLSAMVQAGHDVTTSAPDCPPAVVADLARLGARHRPIPLARRGLNPARDAGYLLRVFRFLRKERIELCLLSTIKPVVFGSLAGRAAGLSNIFSLITGLGYAFMPEGASGRWLTRLTKLLYRQALRWNQTVFFQNPDDRDLFVREGLVEADKTCLVSGSGVDLGQFAPEPMPAGPPLFLMIARLLKAKGVMEFLRAAGQVKARFPQVRFRLVGRPEAGPDALPFSAIERWVRAGIVEYISELPDVRPQLRECSVFVLPSYREGTPRSVLEALAAARPVITTAAPGCKETVVEGVNGLLVPPRDSGALALAMERLIADPALAERFGAASRRLAEEKFDVRVVNRIMLERMGLASNRQ